MTPNAVAWTPATERKNFIAAVTKSGKYKSMLALMQRTVPPRVSFFDTIQSFLMTQSITIFLPTDSAWAAVSIATQTALKTGDNNYLQAVLLFQVVGARLNYTTLSGLKQGTSLTTKWKSQNLQKIALTGVPVNINPVGKTATSAVVDRDVFLPSTGSMAVQGVATFLFPTYP